MSLMKKASHALWRLRDHSVHYFDRPLGLLLIIAYKLLWGSAEMMIGWIVMHSYNILSQELVEDPQDLLARTVLTQFHLTPHDLTQIGSIVFSFGLMKVLLAGCLWMRVRYIREVGLVIFSTTALYGMYHLFVRFSWITVIAVCADFVFIYYFYQILPRHLNPKDQLYE
jgi:uncharacterized membrane protein